MSMFVSSARSAVSLTCLNADVFEVKAVSFIIVGRNLNLLARRNEEGEGWYAPSLGSIDLLAFEPSLAMYDHVWKDKEITWL